MTKCFFKAFFIAPVALWLFLISQGVSAQCSCRWEGPFSWVVQDSASVLLGRVVASQGNSFDVEIAKQIKGREIQQVVRVWADSGDLCRPDVARFPVGSEWLLALERITEVPPGGFNPQTPNISYGRLGDYAISKCGAYWLKHDDGLVSGNITSLFEWDYDPEMNPVPLGLIERFINGEADYADIISVSNEVTSPEAFNRMMKERFKTRENAL